MKINFLQKQLSQKKEQTKNRQEKEESKIKA
jgi:hypothetical protein